ncbi:MAG: membrane dipeptidase, partial [Xanthomonas perforans]|nr:membrane dipeptidase [Xanthomonas perforans]
MIALLLLAQAAGTTVETRVENLLAQAPIIDGHNDLAWELRETGTAVDLSRDTSRLPRPLQTDIPRLRKGGVGGQFWSVWIPAT